jgi:hypothetical protein
MSTLLVGLSGYRGLLVIGTASGIAAASTTSSEFSVSLQTRGKNASELAVNLGLLRKFFQNLP